MEDANPTTNTADWPTIGYSAPGVGASNSYASNVITYNGADKSWEAVAKVNLNDCTSGKKWKMQATINGTSVFYADSQSDGECKNLTPAWTGLYRASN
jgi:hypothetical protein